MSFRSRALAAVSVLICSCASLPEIKHQTHHFPKEAFLNQPTRPFDVLGTVRSKVEYPTLDPNHEESSLCRNYFNAAVKKLVDLAKKKGGDAVMDVRSVVFLLDGRSETYSRAECADDGSEGQVLAQGTAIRWKPEEKPQEN